MQRILYSLEKVLMQINLKRISMECSDSVIRYNKIVRQILNFTSRKWHYDRVLRVYLMNINSTEVKSESEESVRRYSETKFGIQF